MTERSDNTSEIVAGERGQFWIADVKIEDGELWPSNSLPGKLTVNWLGRPDLKIDGVFASDGPIGNQSASSEAGVTVAGFLFDSRRYIWMPNARFSRLSHGDSTSTTAQYVALSCLIGWSPFVSPEGPHATKIEFALDGLEEWFWMNDIDVVHESETTIVTYKKPADRDYQIAQGKIVVASELYGIDRDRKLRQIELRQAMVLRFEPTLPISLEEVGRVAGRIEDLLIILTDAEVPLDPPQIWTGDDDRPAILYRSGRPQAKGHATAAENWTSFPKIANIFGPIVESWLTKSEAFGPGFHLYLGTRRGLSLGQEHHFVNMIWGLESLHRRTREQIRNANLEEKIRRIVDCIDDSKDRKWLQRQLAKTSELSLENRLLDLFSILPLRFEETKLRGFTKRCAELRNDLSHFGGLREEGSYRAFIAELYQHGAVLGDVYHALILLEIGVPREMIEKCFLTAITSGYIRSKMKQVGLEIS